MSGVSEAILGNEAKTSPNVTLLTFKDCSKVPTAAAVSPSGNIAPATRE